MATQICPSCQEDAFTWSIDEEQSDFTIWGCYKCGYHAEEDETKERSCSKCGKPTESKLKDNQKEFWWCSSCNHISIIKSI